MSSLNFYAFPSMAFQKKPRTLDGASEVRDPLVTASPSFDWADEVEHEFYSGSSPDVSSSNDGDGDGDLVVGHSFPPGLSVSRESGYSLAIRPAEGGMGPDEGVGSRSTTADSIDTPGRGLLDLDRMFASSCPPREYKVASVPSLCAIQEGDEETEDDVEWAPSGAVSLDADPSTSTAFNSDFVDDSPTGTEHFDPVANDVDSLRSPLVCVANAEEGEKGLAVDDSDSGWVWVEAEDDYKDARARADPGVLSVIVPPGLSGPLNDEQTWRQLFMWDTRSGAVYYAVWLNKLNLGAVMVFRTSQYNWWNPQPPSSSPAEQGSWVLMNGALVPAIAIYPAVIIVLVALNRSNVEKGLTPRLESLPTSNIAVTTDVIATSARGNGSHSAVLASDGHGLYTAAQLATGIAGTNA